MMNPAQQPQPEIPPHSRLFVACSRSLTKEQLETHFGQHGTIERIKMVTDRTSGQFKGTAFIKYAKASSAAFAMEALNGQAIEGHPPLKVMFAEPRGADGQRATVTSDPFELPPRSRLFVTCPKDMSKDDLKNIFGVYGEVESIKMLPDKVTNQFKGIAYVKYAKASAAALAVEQISAEAANATGSRPVRCRVAEPRGAPPGTITPGGPVIPMGIHPHGAAGYMSMAHYPVYPMMEPQYMPMHEMTHFPEYPPIPPGFNHRKNNYGPGATAEQRRHDNNTPPGSRLFISFSKSMPQALLQSIFMRYGPLETVYLVKGKNYGYAKYATAHAAQVAIHNLHNKLVEGVACRVSVADPQRASFQKKR
uniref:RRM domain-containing protein n=1 Tax=Eutreptiella gymnastica TaxID=73025 RepID=A0A7S1NAA3_9EUGL|mmetsp:Transcript_14170/g.25272  ORF Transcript_14170/g.25272 Transcript_14170/m.25272 type:complete len:364 (+) Transcript_14170:44-1135(+)